MVTNRSIPLAIVGFVLGIASAAFAEEDVLLSMPEPPAGFVVSKHPIEVDGKRMGSTVLVQREGSSGKVFITIETSFDRSAKAARVAATKGYVNGLAGTLKKAGFTLTKSKLPNLEKEEFAGRVVTEMTFTNAEGVTLHTRQFAFFTKNGHDVAVASTDLEELEFLADWAQRIEAAQSGQGAAQSGQGAGGRGQ